VIKTVIALSVVSVISVFSVTANWALSHALFNRSEPRVGQTVSRCPKQVRLWFDSQLEPSSSTVRVESQTGKRVDNLDGHVDSSDATILEVSLPCLSPGTYRVIWKVVSLDGHSTNGSFVFTIE
jgi:methionine-rich copper-binding protein CopC